MCRPICWLALPLIVSALYGQQLPYPSYLHPSALYVGSGPATISLFNQSYRAGLTALWNGSPRPASRDSIGNYVVSVSAADLAAPQLATITMIDAQSGVVIDTVNCPVVYNVQPTGLAVDAGRHRLYIGTPPKPADPQFPGNSVVSIDVTTGAFGPVYQAGSTLGDLALSDDGSALYVVDEGNSVVRRLDPATLAQASQFSFRAPGASPIPPSVTVQDSITVMPGKAGTVALGFSPNIGSSPVEIAIFDNGVMRPNTRGQGYTANLNWVGSQNILFSPDGKYLFTDGTSFFSEGPSAGGNQSATLRWMLDSTGIPKQTPAFASGGAPVAVAGGVLYTALDNTIDYTNMVTTGNFGVTGSLAVDTASQRAFVLYAPPPIDSGGDAPPVELTAFALPSLEALGTQQVRLAAPPRLPASKQLIRFGADGFIVPSTAGLLLFHSPLAGPAPAFGANTVANGASQKSGPIAPGEVLAIKGSSLGPPMPEASPASVQVWFGRLPGTVLAAVAGQVNVIAPFELQPGAPVNLQVLYFGIPSAEVSVPVTQYSPALFTRDFSGVGPVLAINQDGSVNTASPAGTIVSLYGTGGGAFPRAADGDIARRPANLTAPVTVSVAGKPAQVLYAGSAPGLTSGVFQLNVQLPGDLASGLAPIVVNIGSQASPQGAAIEIR